MLKKTSEKPCFLSETQSGCFAEVISLAEGVSSALQQRFMDIGILKGEQVEVMHRAPFGRSPIAVRVRGTIFALRESDARLIVVEEKPA